MVSRAKEETDTVIVSVSYLGSELASLEGFEPPTRCLEGSRSIH
jgi:hypothetical protein